jgi:hypothetical protein
MNRYEPVGLSLGQNLTHLPEKDGALITPYIKSVDNNFCFIFNLTQIRNYFTEVQWMLYPSISSSGGLVFTVQRIPLPKFCIRLFFCSWPALHKTLYLTALMILNENLSNAVCLLLHVSSVSEYLFTLALRRRILIHIFLQIVDRSYRTVKTNLIFSAMKSRLHARF